MQQKFACPRQVGIYRICSIALDRNKKGNYMDIVQFAENLGWCCLGYMKILSGCCKESQKRSLVQRRSLLGSRVIHWSCSNRSSHIPSHPRNDPGHLHQSWSGQLLLLEGCDNYDLLVFFCSRRGEWQAWLGLPAAKLVPWSQQVLYISFWLRSLFFFPLGLLGRGIFLNAPIHWVSLGKRKREEVLEGGSLQIHLCLPCLLPRQAAWLLPRGQWGREGGRAGLARTASLGFFQTRWGQTDQLLYRGKSLGYTGASGRQTWSN